ncbi:MAG: hypothetical protein CM1200mP11_4960 [Nitrosopumilaceae archaeon]|nr:MAG: hypothetical protein CM1200mP11_4960 [Nitrosopumilaceae archaeon]
MDALKIQEDLIVRFIKNVQFTLLCLLVSCVVEQLSLQNTFGSLGENETVKDTTICEDFLITNK